MFTVATFINYLLLDNFWITCCSFYISTCCFTLHFYVVQIASFFKHHEPTSASVKLFFCREEGNIVFCARLWHGRFRISLGSAFVSAEGLWVGT